MGIEGLNTFVKTKYNLFRPYHVNRMPKPTHLYLDLNNILHRCGRTPLVKVFFKKLSKSLRSLLKTLRPSEMLFYAIDGPGPHSKLLEQRKRRWASALKAQRTIKVDNNHKTEDQEMKEVQDNQDEQDIEDDDNDEEGEGEEEEGEEEEEDQEDEEIDEEEDDNEEEEGEEEEQVDEEEDEEEKIVYVGTSTTTTTTTSSPPIPPKRKIFPVKEMDPNEFQSVLLTPGSPFMQRVKDEVIKFSVETVEKTFLPNNILISSSDSKGEGEWKIFHHINHTIIPNQKTHIIVHSSDSDLLLYSLLSPIQIFLVQGEYGKFTYVDSFEFKNSIANSCPNKDPTQAIVDFVMLCFCNGSDYLPKLIGFHFQKTWSTYCSDKSSEGLYNLETKQFNWSYFTKVTGGAKNVTTNILKTKITPSVLIGRFNAACSILYGCNKEVVKPRVETIAIGNKKYKSSFTVDGKLYEAEGGTPAKAKNTLVAPFVVSTHPFWKKYMANVSDIHRQLIENAINGPEEGSKEQEKSLIPKESLLNKFFEVLAWNMEYARTLTQNYTYFYHHASPPTIDDFALARDINLQINPNLIQKDPFTPLEFSVALSNALTKHTVPSIFHSLLDTADHFDYSNQKIWRKEESVDILKDLIEKVINENMAELNEENRLQLSFQPSKVVSRSKNNRNIPVITDVDLYDMIEKLPLNSSKPTSIFNSNNNSNRYHPYGNKGNVGQQQQQQQQQKQRQPQQQQQRQQGNQQGQQRQQGFNNQQQFQQQMQPQQPIINNFNNMNNQQQFAQFKQQFDQFQMMQQQQPRQQNHHFQQHQQPQQQQHQFQQQPQQIQQQQQQNVIQGDQPTAIKKRSRARKKPTQ